jgi:hypothetical protein
MIGNLGGALLAAAVHGADATIENIFVEACTIEASATSPSRYGLIFDVPGGVISGCTLEMADKTAFLGWYPQSGASPTFSGNTVSGSARTLLVVRRTRGAPVVEGNRFTGPRGMPLGPAGVERQLVRIDNPNARVDGNQFVTR